MLIEILKAAGGFIVGVLFVLQWRRYGLNQRIFKFMSPHLPDFVIHMSYKGGDDAEPGAERTPAELKTLCQHREPFGGRMYGIWDVEGDSEPIGVFPTHADADHELKRRQALPEEDDDHLDKFHHVFSCDIVGAWFNSHDPDPREEALTIEEVVAIQEGDL